MADFFVQNKGFIWSSANPKLVVDSLFLSLPSNWIVAFNDCLIDWGIGWVIDTALPSTACSDVLVAAVYDLGGLCLLSQFLSVEV